MLNLFKMNSFDGIEEPVSLSCIGRKKPRFPGLSERELAKRARHSGEGNVPTVNCQHNGTKTCFALSLSETDLKHFSNIFYLSNDKVKQDASLLNYMNITYAKRARVNDALRKKMRDVSVKYSALKNDNTTVPICKASFLSILGECIYYFCYHCFH